MFIVIKMARMVLLLLGIILTTFLVRYYGFEGSQVGNTSIVHAFAEFLSRLFHGEKIISGVTGEPVFSELKARWPATLELGMIAFIFSLMIGLSIGILAAIKEHTWIDRFLISISVASYSIPVFWFALILILFFSVNLDLLPVSGRLDVVYDIQPVTGFMLIDTLLKSAREQYHFAAFQDAIIHLILPVLVLGSMPAAVFARITRSSMLNVLSKDYILSARARGLPEWRVIGIHALRNALPAIISAGGLQFVSTVVTGSMVAELIFGWPGIGNYMVQSLYARDFELLQIFLLTMGIIVLVMNTSIDLVLHWINVRRNR